jgi:hypothetical protein
MKLDPTKLLHPELLMEFLHYNPIFQEIWDRTEIVGGFEERLYLYFMEAQAVVEAELPRHSDRHSLRYLALTLAPALPIFVHCQDQLDDYSNWSELVEHEQFELLQQFLVRELGHDWQTSSMAIRIWFVFHAWRKSQEQIYTVTPDLEWGLRNTEVKGFQCDNLRLPYPCVYVQLPRDMKIWNQDTGLHDADGAYIVEYESVLDEYDYAKGTRLWLVCMCGKSKDPDKPFDDAVSYYRIALPEGKSIEEAVRRAREHMIADTEHSPHFRIEDFRLMESTIFSAFRYVMNVMIYATRKDDRVFCDASPQYEALKQRMLKAKGKKREKLKKRLRDLEERPRVLLGGKLYTGNRLRKEAADAAAEGAGVANGRTIQVRFLVSGHYREQACGVGRKDRKTIWIEPHWKGPELAPLTERTREVR